MTSFINKTFEAYSLEELSKKYTEVFLYLKSTSIKKTLSEEILNDDENRSNLWTEAYKSAGYYYDRPTPKQRTDKFNYFRYNFGSIIKDNLPEVNSKKELLTWVCKKHNEYLNLKGIEENVNCDYEFLKKQYGYNEKKVVDTFGNSIYLKL